jgi:hypothetical protein
MLLHILISLNFIPFKYDALLYAQLYVRVKILMANEPLTCRAAFYRPVIVEGIVLNYN